MSKTLFCFALLLILSSHVFAQVTAVPDAMHFQGRLAKPDGTPLADGNYTVRFSLHDALTGGAEKWNQTVNPVNVRKGAFAALLSGFPAGTFNTTLFLEIKIGTDAPLTPRQQLVSVAYAMKAESVKDNAITSASIADGTITADDIAPAGLNTLSWLLTGNASPAPDSFLGTRTNFPLELRVNNHRAMEYRYFENTLTPAGQEYRSINVLGGSSVNSIEFGIVGATIAGGGKDFFSASLGDGPNRVTAEFGTIGGGFRNLASGPAAVVAGGEGNSATSSQSTVAGGQFNTASGQLSSVLGGYNHIASGLAATVAGGFSNQATATTSFAAGNNARAIHTGSFVWGDSQSGIFASTAANQFLIRASGGVGINTNSLAGYTLNVNGSIRATSLNLSGSQSTAGSSAVTGNHTVGGNLNVGGTLRIGNVPFGDYRNVQIHGTTGQIYYDNSSRKHKENITPLVDDFEKLLQAVPMTYTRPNAPGRWEIGFIAEDFDDLGLKRLVDYGEKGEVEGINYEKICLYLTAIARKQNDRLAAQQTQMETLKQHNDRKDAEVNALKAEVAELKALMQQLVHPQKAEQK